MTYRPTNGLRMLTWLSVPAAVPSMPSVSINHRLGTARFASALPMLRSTAAALSLSGNLMEAGGISERLVHFARSLVGGVQGGLAMSCVITCMIFAAVSGSSVATTFAIGAILIPVMIKVGYPVNKAAALQAT